MVSDDFLYDFPNKEYGAYKLRKLYKRTVYISLIITAVITALVFTIYYLRAMQQELTEDFIISANIIPIELSDIKIDEPKEKLPEQANKEQQVLVPQTAESPLKDMRLDSTANAVKSEEKKVEPEKGKGEKDDDPRLKGEAMFSCGGNLNSFRNWFLNNFKYPESIKNKKVEGKIVLQFTVDRRGLIDSVKILSGIDPVLDNEAKAVLKTAPRWNPCIIDGRPVKQLYIFPVFIVPRR